MKKGPAHEILGVCPRDPSANSNDRNWVFPRIVPDVVVPVPSLTIEIELVLYWTWVFPRAIQDLPDPVSPLTIRSGSVHKMYQINYIGLVAKQIRPFCK